ncbi:SCO3242 family prenyltransferase [Thermomonospora amylolytica]|uniref:SCO3242 family prenyltransferase n=1 Tax=Thermomonospora amylolytica TaxID=1411117 RepID=UPI000E6B5151|nr:UbiA family prenyltransferase [Thermomonospora amylolytica]
MNVVDLTELVRAPAALTVPGDVLAGGAGGPAAAVSSVCLYWAGMALNDYADRAVDAGERPRRPIPSGRVAPNAALALAAGLTGAGLAAAAVTGGRRRLALALPLAVTVWAYDLRFKGTAVGPVVMAAARVQDVLLGGGARALLPALAIGVHTCGVTVLSRGEVRGTDGVPAYVALAATAVAAVLAARPVRSEPLGRRAARLCLAAAYAGSVGWAQTRAARRRDPVTVRAAVGAGICGLLPLQAAFTAAQGRTATAAALAAIHPVARLLSRKVSPT